MSTIAQLEALIATAKAELEALTVRRERSASSGKPKYGYERPKRYVPDFSGTKALLNVLISQHVADGTCSGIRALELTQELRGLQLPSMPKEEAAPIELTAEGARLQRYGHLTAAQRAVRE